MPPVVKLPQQETPKPKSKMRKFQWNKIPINKVVGRKNLWTNAGKMCKQMNPDFSRIEELFSLSDTTRPKPKDTIDGSPAPEKKKRDEVSPRI